MKKNKSITIQFTDYESLEALAEKDQLLLKAAINIAQDAYAPYSNFKVGAAVELENGAIVTGSNQENAAYPSGLCAERVALFSASANYSNKRMKTIAVYAVEPIVGEQISPCGSCRQVMSEYELKQNDDLRVLLMNADGKIREFASCSQLLPFAFILKPFKNG